MGRLCVLRRALLHGSLAVESQRALFAQAGQLALLDFDDRMWRAYTALGFLEYSFVETTEALHPMYVIRAFGGFLFLVGALIMAFNLFKTIISPEACAVPEEPSSVKIRFAGAE